jgi:endonuclease YncB( thermonuclease family)
LSICLVRQLLSNHTPSQPKNLICFAFSGNNIKVLKMRHFLRLLQNNTKLFTQVSTRLLIGFSAIFIIPSVAVGDNNAPFSISGMLKITNISDGDSLRSGKLRIRLFGVDAPEKKQQCNTIDGQQWDCGVKAQQALKQLVESVPQLSCDLIDVDRYARLLMRCYAGKTDVAAALVRAGMALAYRQYSALYVKDENSAKIARAGMWNGSFTKPWEWRHTRKN